MKKVIIKQDEKSPVPIEVLAESIREISAAIKKLRKGPLGEKALLLLIHANTKGVGPKRGIKHKISMSEIKAVLESLETLEKQYCK